MKYEGVSLDEQINNLLDDLEEFNKTELDIDMKKFKNGRYLD